ncbi:calcium-binding protein (plasmid) [Devosia sp. A8/3-2]|nr:calcium-binding protein [Devosia sp. A8/3-2]
MHGNSGNDLLNGGLGADWMVGGAGDDSYVVDDAGDTVVEASGGGTDTVHSSISYSLGAYVENLTLTGNQAINGTGNGLDNVLVGNSASNILVGGAGNDTLDGGIGADILIGGIGDDIYVVDDIGDTVTEGTGEGADLIRSSIDYVLGAYVEHLTLTGAEAINGTGNAFNNTISGNTADNALTGGLGDDTLFGGDGDDTLVGGAGADAHNGRAGFDYASYAAATAGIYAHTGAPSSNTGEAAGDTYSSIEGLRGSGFADELIPVSDNGRLHGGAGNDTLTVVGNRAEISGEDGNDKLYGHSGDDHFYGGTGDDSLFGSGGADWLDGGAGADYLTGGSGDDTYIVDDVGDVVAESSGQGIDHVRSAITYSLTSDTENLTLTGSAAINGTGNGLDNDIIGNAANNILSGGAGHDTLDGGAGADIMSGGLGNDTYYVDAAGDVIVEASGEGVDLVVSSISTTLGSNVENLTPVGASAVSGTGNGLNNIITGSELDNVLNGGAGNDTLDGGIGADTLVGGIGSDTFIVDNAGDVVTELSGEGTDWVRSSISYALGAHVENPVLTGTGNTSGAGNALGNVIRGMSATTRCLAVLATTPMSTPRRRQ